MNGPFAHAGLNEPYERHTEVVAAVRDAIGPDVALLVDVQYLWSDAETAFAHDTRLGGVRFVLPRDADLGG